MAIVSVALMTGNASAIVMHSMDLNQRYIDNAVPSVGGLLTMVDGEWHLSSVTNYNKEWGIVTRHQIDNYGIPDAVVFGGNAFTTPISSEIDDCIINPFGDDLALVHYKTPLVDVPGNTIGQRPQIGDEIRFGGFGRYGTPYNLIDQQDGNARGADGYVTGWISGDMFESEWRDSYFDNGHELGGLGAPGDSGSPVISTLDGALLGLAKSISSSNSYHHYVRTQFVDLTTEQRRSWIETTAVFNEAPTPTSFVLLGVGLIGFIGVKRKYQYQ